MGTLSLTHHQGVSRIHRHQSHHQAQPCIGGECEDTPACQHEVALVDKRRKGREASAEAHGQENAQVSNLAGAKVSKSGQETKSLPFLHTVATSLSYFYRKN